MKPKKPARIKGVITRICGEDDHEPIPRLTIPIDNPDALVEQVARAICDGSRNWEGAWDTDLPKDARPSYLMDARAALRSIGVPLKK